MTSKNSNSGKKPDTTEVVDKLVSYSKKAGEVAVEGGKKAVDLASDGYDKAKDAYNSEEGQQMRAEVKQGYTSLVARVSAFIKNVACKGKCSSKKSSKKEGDK